MLKPISKEILYLIMAKQQRPKETNKLAKSIVFIGTVETPDETNLDAIRLAAAALGRKGGLKGGKARADSLSPERRAEIARKAAAARWGHKDD